MVKLRWFRSIRCESHACVEVSIRHDAAVLVRDSKDLTIVPLAFPAASWRAFITGIRAGQFDSKEGS